MHGMIDEGAKTSRQLPGHNSTAFSVDLSKQDGRKERWELTNFLCYWFKFCKPIRCIIH